jgi:RES domain-containing protein
VHVEYIETGAIEGWDAPQSSIARQFGDEWVREGRTAILVVPSLAASGLARNILINQDHAGFRQLTATRPQPVIWDKRLFGR